MKPLSAYLTEQLSIEIPARLEKLVIRKYDNTVWHFTNIDAAKGILKSNEFWVGKGRNDLSGFSTTYDPSYNFGQRDVCFHLDYKKLANDYVPYYVDAQLGVDESEIRFLSDETITNIDKYIKDITTEVDDDELLSEIAKYKAKYL